ncbi:MAG: hydrogenase formation protein HypD [Desulfovibrio sp.]|jgi:hydrogenase expression/formation protein HypD|nr:hydrogenase formation protein HypD [Desulfovibrio sp.]
MSAHNRAFSDPILCRGLLEKIRAELDFPLRFMEVCGTHTAAVFRAGLPSLWPEEITHISGPGCPVCVTHVRDIAACLELAGRENLTLACFGDMMRIPGPGGMSLGKARAEGADVRVVYSPLEALDYAAENSKRPVVFLGVGFETTAPAAAAVILRAARARLKNFAVLSLHKLVPAALRALLDDQNGSMGLKAGVSNRKGSSDENGRDGERAAAGGDAVPAAVDALLLPGHVSTIIGLEPYSFIAGEFGKPGVVGGFEPADILQSLLLMIRMLNRGEAEIQNQYRRAVEPEGNAKARALLEEVFAPADALWRGLGAIPQSGLEIRPAYADFDAARRFLADKSWRDKTRYGPEENPACKCGEILRGRLRPRQCPLFGKACVPEHPSGPCMVSAEGSCAAVFRYQADL